MNKVRVLIVFAIVLAIVVVAILIPRSGRRSAVSENNVSISDIHKQDGIIPAYHLVAGATNNNMQDVIIEAVASGNLSLQGLRMLVSRLYAEAHNSHSAAKSVTIRLYLNDADVLGGPSSSIVSYSRVNGSPPRFVVDDARLNSLGVPVNAPDLFTENQRRDVFRMLHAPETRHFDNVAAKTDAALMARYGLTQEALRSIRDEGRKKKWANGPDSER